jgi:TolA-binding protein
MPALSGAHRNKALWLIMEAGLATGKSQQLVSLASQSMKDSGYALHILHCLGRSYVKSGDLSTAQSVFEGALRQKPHRDIDNEAYQRISLSLAQLLYERGNYQKALPLFFSLLNQEKSFADALFGIVWCYFALGDYQKAETSLRKLINQSPWSPLAAQALLTAMQRSVAVAKSKWERFLSLSREEQHLQDKSRALSERALSDTAIKNTGRYSLLVSKIQGLLSAMREEAAPLQNDIRGNYEIASKIAKVINDHYKTGTFQEVNFSEKREKCLKNLDSLLMVSQKNTGAFTPGQLTYSQSMRDVSAIKNIVRKSRAFEMETMFDYYRWERENNDWQKLKLKRALEEILRKAKNAPDSMTRSTFKERVKRQNGSIDSLVRDGDAIARMWRDLLIRKCAEILPTHLDSTDESYIRYHLGEIYYERENENYAAAFAAYEDSVTALDSLKNNPGQGTGDQAHGRPHEPRMSHGKSMEQFRNVLQKYPHCDLAHAVHYSLAWCFNDENLFDSAMAHMRFLAVRYPTSQYTPQAWMYMGEYLFDHAKLDSALTAYQAVMKFPESEWFEKALYKLAWTQYRLSNPDKAIGSFLALVELGEKEHSDKTLLGKESIEYIAISFSETDATGEKGLERAVNFVTQFGDKAKGALILHRLASIFKEQGRFGLAQKTYAKLLRLYPENKNSPFVEAELLAVLEKSGTPEEADMNKLDFYNKYHKNGAWAKIQTDAVTLRIADSIAAKMLYEASISYHQLALRKNDSTFYAIAAENYQTYIEHYPQSAQASECHYNLAEIMFSMGNYLGAAEEYIAVSNQYPDSKYRETAAWNAIVASQNLLKTENGATR